MTENTNKPSLYGITDRLLNLQALVEDETLTAEQVGDALAEVEGELSEKADGYIALHQMYRNKAAQVDTEIKRMQAYKKWLQAQDKRLDGSLLYAMDTLGRKSIIAGLGKISWQNNPPSLEVLNENGIPAEFLTVVPEQVIPEHLEVNKAALKAALVADLKAGGNGALMFGEAMAAQVVQSRRVVIK